MHQGFGSHRAKHLARVIRKQGGAKGSLRVRKEKLRLSQPFREETW